ncbi:ABC transporter G family member 22 [Linum perenne]
MASSSSSCTERQESAVTEAGKVAERPHSSHSHGDLVLNIVVVDDDDDDFSDQTSSKHISNSGSVCLEKSQFGDTTFPISLKFEDLKYKIAPKGTNGGNKKKLKHEEKLILDGITGIVNPGEILALMGPSGGGKTTLLNLLSGRIKSSDGIITYNDQPYTKSLKRRFGFVTQDDVVFPHLTVKETLTYSALLQLPNVLTTQQKMKRVVNVITELGLERCQNTMVGGNLLRGISGGERKRVCIGNEILLNPSLLFLDEPTSSLDSTTALRIVRLLQNIAKEGKTVVTTMHQPSSRMFSKFDKLILLGKGSSLYFGEVSQAMPYFSSIGCHPLIAMNPAEFLIDLANGDLNYKSVPAQLVGKLLLRSGKRLPSPADVQEFLVEACRSKLRKEDSQQAAVLKGKAEILRRPRLRRFEANWWDQFSILFKRGFKEKCHEYLSLIRMTQVVAVAMVMVVLWWHSDASSPDLQAGLLFFISVFWGFLPLYNAIFTFQQERLMLAKERSVGMYRLSAYFAARSACDLLLDLTWPVLFLVVVYFAVGLKSSFSAFLLTLLTLFLNVIAAQGLGLAIGVVFVDLKKATTLASVILMSFMLSGGYFLKKVPKFMGWVPNVSFNYQTFRLLLKIQYSCSPGSSGFYHDECGFIREMGVDKVGPEVGALFLMIIAYRMLAYLSLRKMKL